MVDEPNELSAADGFFEANKLLQEIAGLGGDSTPEEIADSAIEIARKWVSNDKFDHLKKA